MPLHLVDPLGFRRDGRPIWSFSGSAPEGESGGTDGGEGGTDGGNPPGDGSEGAEDDTNEIGADGLNGRGRQTILNLRGEVRGFKQEVKGWRLIARDFGEGGKPLTPDEVRERLSRPAVSPPSTGEPVDVERIRRDAERAANVQANQRIALADIRALAAEKFEDPADAVAFLRGDVENLLNRDGEPDEKAIADALDELLQKKPHLGKRTEGPPNYDGGPRGSSAPSGSMTDLIRARSREKTGRR
jgi:hypothetical protein